LAPWGLTGKKNSRISAIFAAGIPSVSNIVFTAHWSLRILNEPSLT
jgi:hypothetical protein